LIIGKVPHQLLKLGYIFSHSHVSLLELQELHLLLVPNILTKVFLQKYPLEDIPGDENPKTAQIQRPLTRSRTKQSVDTL